MLHAAEIVALGLFAFIAAMGLLVIVAVLADRFEDD